ncbi:MAG: sensor histidine kinase, partial [Bradyrhizobium sp.]
MKLFDEFRRGWHGESQTSILFGIAFAAVCLVLATAARWGISLIRSDIFFTPYLPAVLFVTAISGLRIGIVTMIASGV